MATTLKRGDSGSAVTMMQSLLVEHSFSMTIDGVFGKDTEKQVKLFQSSKNLAADGICGEKTWAALEDTSEVLHLPIDWQRFVDLFPELEKQKYQLSKAQAPSNPPGVSLKRLGYETTSCVLFTAWIVPMAFEGVRFAGDQWSRWMVSKDAPSGVHPVPGYGPGVTMEWGIGTTAPGPGVYLVQLFSETTGHSLLVVDHCEDTGKILTLEATNVAKLNGAGWFEIGNLRDCPNPGPRWMDKVDQTWASRFDGRVATHFVRLAVDPASVKKWLNSA